MFADVTVSGPEEVKQNWDAIKAAERAEAARRARLGARHGPLRPARPVAGRAAPAPRRAGWAGRPPGLADLPPGLAGLPPGDPTPTGEGDGDAGDAEGALAGGDAPAGGQAVSDIGAELFALVARAREAGLDPELELRAAARAYRDRVRAWERSGRG